MSGLYKPRAPDSLAGVLDGNVFYNLPGLGVVLYVKFKLERVQQSDANRELIQTYSPLLYRFHRIIQWCFWMFKLRVGLKAPGTVRTVRTVRTVGAVERVDYSSARWR